MSIKNYVLSFKDDLDFLIRDFIKDIINYIKNRYFIKTHYLRTNLTPGRYYEFEYRVLNGIFNEFIYFMEVEKYRNNQNILNLEITNSQQDKWELDAYKWWKITRPQRPDPFNFSGLADYFDKRNGDYSLLYSNYQDLEKRYYEEDTYWLIELIKRREEIWH